MPTMQQRLTAGDSLVFLVTLDSYPANSGWVLSYRLASRTGATAYTFTGTASGVQHAINVPAATTAGWAAGDYTCGAWVTNGSGERHTIASESGQVVIVADPATLPAGTDVRTSAELALDAIRAVLAGRATDAVQRYKIRDREVWRYTIPELIALEKHFVSQVDNERKAAGLMGGTGGVRRILVRTAQMRV